MTKAELLTRIEVAPEGGRELDHDIAFAVRWRPDEVGDPGSARSFAKHEAAHDYATAWISHKSMNPSWKIPHYSTSLDAKLPGENIVSMITLPDGRFYATHDRGDNDFTSGLAHTEPLSRRAAAIRGMEDE